MNDKIYTFRDAKLNSLPIRLINSVGAGMAALGLDYPDLSPAAMIAAAKKRTGLDDLGDADIHEALQNYCDSAAREAHLNLLGRFAVRNMLVNALSNRSQVIDWAKRHPQINDEKIHQPWIVVGLPRTGTSLLCSLLGLDPGSRPLLQWEAARPMPPADLASAAEDPRIAAFANDIKRVMKVNPALASMHPFGSTLAEECTAVFTYSLRTIGIEAIAFVPSYGHWLDRCDMRSTYALHKTVLQSFQHAQPTERWVLKSPNHLWCLDALMATYPDARVIWMHRDPADLVTSLASINNAMQISFTDKHDPVRVGNYWADKAAYGIERASAFDAAQPAGWCYHVQYDDLMADSAGTIEKIYRNFGDELKPLHRRRVDTWLRHRPQNAFGRHRYDPRDYGWTPQQLKARFSDYRRRYGIRAAGD